MADETRTADQLAQDYTAMGHSVDLINGIIDGSRMKDETQEDKNDCVDRNVRHLEIMVAKEDWGSEDMTPSNDAITAGKAYIA
tara:strand:+ start:376 stop:624 length:249 start_codon:yes stop_codon:yes gene_type:complete